MNLAEHLNPEQRTVLIKNEPLDEPFISGNPVNAVEIFFEISNTEDQGFMPLQPNGTSVPIKKEDDEIKFLREDVDDYTIVLDTKKGPNVVPILNLGKSFLKGLDPRASLQSWKPRKGTDA